MTAYTAKEIAAFLKSGTDLASLKPAGLLAAYNGVAEFLGETPVKKFTDRKTAEKRVAAIIVKGQAKVASLVAKKAAPKTNGTKAHAAPKTGQTITVAARMRSLIADGHDNAAVFAICQKEFNLPDAKKSYPAWYRRQMNLAAGA